MSVVDEIKQRIDIVDLIGETVRLRRSGKAYAGFCPFHPNTRTPAFYVFPETQTWYCFGACGTGGDIFTFVMKKENVDFSQALHMLATRAGVQLRSESEGDARLKRLIAIHQAAAAYYHHVLQSSPDAQPAREYLHMRQIHPQSIAKFELGYAPKSYHALLDHLRGKGYAISELEQAGLIVSGEDGRVWDRFRGRLMFPIRNRHGETIGFGARALADDQQPKYLNSPDSPLFHKNETLYGLDLARDAIRRENLAVIVEGYMDVIIAHQAGFANVVAALGTALTEKQLLQLSRLTRRYVLALDADVAGAAATERGLELARQALAVRNRPVPVGPGLIAFKERLESELMILELPSGRDPDEVILDRPDEWRRLVAMATPLLDYYFETQARGLDLNSAAGKSEYVKRLLPIIAQLKDWVQRAHYAQRLARRVQFDERLVLDQLRQFDSAAAPVRVNQGAKEAPSRPSAAKFDEYLITLALYAPDLLPRVDFVSADDFQNGVTREIWEALKRYTATSIVFDAEEFLKTLSEAARETGVRLREAGKRLQFSPGESVREIEAAAYRLRLQRFQDELNQLRHLLAEASPEESTVLTQRVSVLSTWIAEIRRAIEARTVLKTSLANQI